MTDRRADFTTRFALLARHEGVWDGHYRHFDAAGKAIDEHRSRLICRIPDSGPHDYVQTNYYSWADGRTEERGFPAVAAGDRIKFESDLINGWAASVTLDQNRRTMMLHWERVGEVGVYLYEMIQISDCGGYRARVWQWFREGRLIQRTLIDEQRVSHEWRTLSGPSYAGDPIPEPA